MTTIAGQSWFHDQLSAGEFAAGEDLAQLLPQIKEAAERELRAVGCQSSQCPSSNGILLGRLRLKNTDNFSHNNGVSERSAFQIHVGQEVFIQRFQQLRNLFFRPSG